jgi:hypothetical protein
MSVHPSHPSQASSYIASARARVNVHTGEGCEGCEGCRRYSSTTTTTDPYGPICSTCHPSAEP